MSRTYGLRTARDLLAKLGRDAELLREEVSSDRFFNFVITAYSLADWVQNDPAINQAAKSDLQRLRSTQTIQICRDLANSGKHFTLDSRRNPDRRSNQPPLIRGTVLDGMARVGMESGRK